MSNQILTIFYLNFLIDEVKVALLIGNGDYSMYNNEMSVQNCWECRRQMGLYEDLDL